MPERFAGKYQMLRHLASGGMGEVFLASLRREAGFAKLVVVKRILPHFAQEPEFVRMFVQEARLSAALDHPNIVRVYDFGRAGDSFFLVMEYLHGDSLVALLPRAVTTPEGLALTAAITIVLGVCAGLHFAHELKGPDGSPLGIVHRDISPANVFVTQAGEVKLLDFGIAKAVAAGTVTHGGPPKGKLAYMSPEQCLGAPLDRRSDIFAVGILLYEMTTMRRLFRGASDFEVMTMITSGKIPPPSSRSLDYPPALEDVVVRALAADPADRYATAQELHDDLERVADELGLRPSTASLGRLVSALTGDKRYPSLDPEAEPVAEEAPTLRFFATLNEAVTAHDVHLDLEPPARPVDVRPAYVSPVDDTSTPTAVRPRRAPRRPALIGAAVLLLAGITLYFAWPRDEPPAPDDAPADAKGSPADATESPADAKGSPAEPLDDDGTSTGGSPPPADGAKPTRRKRRGVKRRDP